MPGDGAGGAPPVRPREDRAVDAMLAGMTHPHMNAVHTLRTVIRGIDPEIRESVKWNAPSYAIARHFATMHLRGGAVQVVMHLDAKPRTEAKLRASIDDPGALLQWRGADRAIVTFSDLADVERRTQAFSEIVRQWLPYAR